MIAEQENDDPTYSFISGEKNSISNFIKWLYGDQNIFSNPVEIYDFKGTY